MMCLQSKYSFLQITDRRESKQRDRTENVSEWDTNNNKNNNK